MRRGIALLSALSLLTLLGLVVVGGVAATVIAQRTRRLSESSTSLAAAAEFAIGSMLADPVAFNLPDAPFGVTRIVAAPAQNGATSVNVAVTRLPFSTYWLVADARSAVAHRRIGVVARARTPAPVPAAAIVARGAVSLASDVLLTVDSSGDADCRVKTGAFVQQSSDSSLYARLDTLSTVRRVHGDTAIENGSFTGILDVDGSITFSGPTSVTGLVMARGAIHGSGLTLTGALVSYAGGPQPAVDLFASSIRYSPCEIARALRRVSPIRLVRRRGWAELF